MADIIQIRYDDAEVTRLFAAITARAQNPRPLLADWGERIKNSVRRNILEGGRPVKFAPLKPVTVRNWLFTRSTWWTKAGNMSQKGRAAQEGRKPLLDTGMSGGLLGSINWRILAANALAVGSDKIYAAIQHFGGTVHLPDIWAKVKRALMWPGALHPVKKAQAHDVTIPARPYLLIQDEDWLYFRQSALQYLLGEGSWK